MQLCSMGKTSNIDRASLLGGKSKYLNSEVTIYTDGSKIGGKVGSGFVVYRRKKIIFYQNARLPDSATVFQAELYAIFLAGRYIQTTLTEKYNYIRIYSDSQAAILALDKNEISSQLVMDTLQIWELITNRNIHVTLSWIKAHVGHEGNELADTQAKLGAGRETVNATTLAPWGSVKIALNEAIQSEWNTRWKNLPKHDATKYFWKKADKIKAGVFLTYAALI